MTLLRMSMGRVGNVPVRMRMMKMSAATVSNRRKMEKSNLTIDYYNQKAADFFAGTVNVDFTDIQQRFLKYLPAAGRILDLGCGAGRDSLAFLKRGFSVVAVDGSETLAAMAEEHTGQPVIVADFREYEPDGTFDGVWACSSLLHLQIKEIPPVLRKMTEHLRAGGCFYVSFKYGGFEGIRNGRYFTDLTEKELEKLLGEVPGLRTAEVFITTDVRPGRSEAWLNAFLVKESACCASSHAL